MLRRPNPARLVGLPFTLNQTLMKIFETPQKIYRYVADSWIQAEQMLADELGVGVNEIEMYIIDRYEL